MIIHTSLQNASCSLT